MHQIAYTVTNEHIIKVRRMISIEQYKDEMFSKKVTEQNSLEKNSLLRICIIFNAKSPSYLKK